MSPTAFKQWGSFVSVPGLVTPRRRSVVYLFGSECLEVFVVGWSFR